MVHISPSMLSCNLLNVGEELKKLEYSGASSIHWDVMDGRFVSNISFGSDLIREARGLLPNFTFDVHLMVQNPDRFISKFVSCGADSITVHVEACDHVHSTIDKIKSYNKLAGIAINPDTSESRLSYLLDVVDFVVVMCVVPGAGGQQFITSQLKKIEILRKILPPNVEICVDGGINPETLKLCYKAGARKFVAGGYVFKKNTDNSPVSYEKRILDLINCCNMII